MGEIKLGDKVKDTVTGFTGVATGRAVYLHRESSLLVEAPVQADGKTPDAWITENRLVVVP